MSLLIKQDNQKVYAPIGLTHEANSNPDLVLSVHNMSDSLDIKDVGIYIKPASDLGEIKFSSDKPAATDFQDLLAEGSRSNSDNNYDSGLKISYIDVAGDPQQKYFSHEFGSKILKKIVIGDINVGDSKEITLSWNGLFGNGSRRLYIGVAIE